MMRRRRRADVEVTRHLDELLSGRRLPGDASPEALELSSVVSKIGLDERERLSEAAKARGKAQLLASSADVPRQHRKPGTWGRGLALASGLVAVVCGVTVAAAEAAPANSPLAPIKQVAEQLAQAIPFVGHNRSQPSPAAPSVQRTPGSVQLHEELRGLSSGQPLSDWLISSARPGQANPDQVQAAASAPPVDQRTAQQPTGSSPGNSATAPGHSDSVLPGQSGAAPPDGSGTSAAGNSGTAPGQSGGTPPGQSGTAPGQSGGTPPGQSGTTPGQSGGTPPGQSGTTPGQSGGASPGQSGTAPGQSGGAPAGQSGTAPGQSGGAPAGQSGTAPGQSGGTPPGQSGTAPGQSGGAPVGQSGTAPQHGSSAPVGSGNVPAQSGRSSATQQRVGAALVNSAPQPPH